MEQVTGHHVPHSHAALTKQPHHTGHGGLQLEHWRLVQAKLTDAAAAVGVPVHDQALAAPRHTAQLLAGLQAEKRTLSVIAYI